ncbi:MAG: hypothetical protein NC820_00475 [Candidatus Omnitrophica bacterium]|nr:hypothetical protein [Candidatus Omnitrophota bacterium]
MRNILVSLVGILFSIIIAGNIFAQNNKTEVVLFYSPHCKSCIELKNEYLNKILEKYADKIELKMLDTTDPKNLSLLIYLAQEYGNKNAFVPSIFIGNNFLVGKKEIEANLENLIDRCQENKFLLPIFSSPQELIERFKSISIFTIISAGLIDGVNPCAFAVIVFFISFLGVYGYDKKEILYIGISYIFSVFFTYILIGLGLLKFLYSLRHFYIIMKIFYYFVGSLCFFLAGSALYDYFKFKKTKQTDGLILQLPDFLKKRINLVIGANLREKKYHRILELCLVSFFVGFSVSILESVCTGQVYLPTIVFILKIPDLRLRAWFYLLIYNLMFISPLVIIFIFSIIGVTSKQFNHFIKNNLGKIKLAMSGLFLFLGIIMFGLS